MKKYKASYTYRVPTVNGESIKKTKDVIIRAETFKDARQQMRKKYGYFITAIKIEHAE